MSNYKELMQSLGMRTEPQPQRESKSNVKYIKYTVNKVRQKGIPEEVFYTTVDGRIVSSPTVKLRPIMTFRQLQKYYPESSRMEKTILTMSLFNGEELLDTEGTVAFGAPIPTRDAMNENFVEAVKPFQDHLKSTGAKESYAITGLFTFEDGTQVVGVMQLSASKVAGDLSRAIYSFASSHVDLAGKVDLQLSVNGSVLVGTNEIPKEYVVTPLMDNIMEIDDAYINALEEMNEYVTNNNAYVKDMYAKSANKKVADKYTASTKVTDVVEDDAGIDDDHTEEFEEI